MSDINLQNQQFDNEFKEFCLYYIKQGYGINSDKNINILINLIFPDRKDDPIFINYFSLIFHAALIEYQNLN